MSLRVLRKGPPHVLSRGVAQRHCGLIHVATDDDGGDRVEVLAVGLQGVGRRLARSAIGQEGCKPLWTRDFAVSKPAWAIGHGAQFVMDNDDYPRQVANSAAGQRFRQQTGRQLALSSVTMTNRLSRTSVGGRRFFGRSGYAGTPRKHCSRPDMLRRRFDGGVGGLQRREGESNDGRSAGVLAVIFRTVPSRMALGLPREAENRPM